MRYDTKSNYREINILPKTTTYADWEITNSYFGNNDYPQSHIDFTLTFY